jgi:hypothetical protein
VFLLLINTDSVVIRVWMSWRPAARIVSPDSI